MTAYNAHVSPVISRTILIPRGLMRRILEYGSRRGHFTEMASITELLEAGLEKETSNG